MSYHPHIQNKIGEQNGIGQQDFTEVWYGLAHHLENFSFVAECAATFTTGPSLNPTVSVIQDLPEKTCNMFETTNMLGLPLQHHIIA